MSPLAFYLPQLAGGGAERVVLALAEAFAGRGHAVDLVLGRRTGALAGAIPFGVGCHVLDRRGSLSSVPPLARYLRDWKPAVLVSSMGHNNIAALLARRLAGGSSKVVICQHNSLAAECGPGRPLRYRALPLAYRALLPLADACIAVSDGVAREMERLCGLPAASVQTIYNPAWSPGLADCAAAADPWLEDGGSPVVLGVGRLVAQKDFSTLLDAFALVRRTMQARLLILGEGPERPALAARIAALGLEGVCRLAGFVANPPAAMARAALVALSSRYEGFGNVLIESMGSGTPVVSTDCPHGPAEILDGGRYGALVPVGDSQALASAILASLSRAPDTETLRRRAAHFTIDRSVRQYACVFDRLARAARPAWS